MEKRQLSRTLNEQSRKWYPILANIKNEDVLHEAINVQQIPAPTFEEEQRADYLEHRFEQMAFDHLDRDTLGNIYGWLGSPKAEDVVIVSAHHDTVFPMSTDLTLRNNGARIYGPGLGDNSLGVAGLLMMGIHVLPHLETSTVSLCLVANVREEGLGNLDGIRAVIDNIGAHRIKAGIVIEGMALGRVYHGGIAVKRLKICTSAEGGHSWMSFGRASAIHGLVQIANDITKIQVPVDPRTTYNIGLIEGGRSINTIATEAHLMLDLRSTDRNTLQHLEEAVRAIVRSYNNNELKCKIKVIGERPSGEIAETHPLVQLALRSLHEIGIAGILEHGSTDANMLLAHNIPSVVVGLSYGGNAHRLDEFIDKTHLKQGFYQLVMLVGATLDFVESQKR